MSLGFLLVAAVVISYITYPGFRSRRGAPTHTELPLKERDRLPKSDESAVEKEERDEAQ